SPAGVYLGLAHGLIGSLFALENARVAFDLSRCGGPIASLRRRVLAVLEATRLRVPGHRGGFWPVTSGERRLTVPGWCHGGRASPLGLLGRLALTHCADSGAPARRALDGIAAVCRADSTCCGRLGQIQILVEAARILDDDRWLEQGSRLARP